MEQKEIKTGRNLYYPKSVKTVKLHLLILAAYSIVLFLFSLFVFDFSNSNLQSGIEKVGYVIAFIGLIAYTFGPYIIIGILVSLYQGLIKKRIYIPVGWGWFAFLVVCNILQGFS